MLKQEKQVTSFWAGDGYVRSLAPAIIELSTAQA